MTQPGPSSASSSATELAIQRNNLADMLDELIQVISEGTKGQRRVPTNERQDCVEWPDRQATLESETKAMIRLLRTKNSRAAARAKQASKRRGLVPGGPR